jgi:SAM-dependent methyltransferase
LSSTDPSKYTVVGHHDLAILNPIGSGKLDDLVDALELDPTARVLDVGCGKGELLARVAARWGCTCVGVDLSPALIAHARQHRGVEAHVGDGKAFVSGTWDVIACVGSSHIFGDLRATVAALTPHLAERGALVLGEGYWRKPPDPAYLESFGGSADEAGPLHALVDAREQGFVTTHVAVASEDEFDRYEWSHARAVERFAREHRDDADAARFLARSRSWRAAYLRWGRETLGFALFVMQRV